MNRYVATARRLGCRRITSGECRSTNHLTGVPRHRVLTCAFGPRKDLVAWKIRRRFKRKKKVASVFNYPTARIVTTARIDFFLDFFFPSPRLFYFDRFYRGRKVVSLGEKFTRLTTACICLQVHKRSQCFTN